MCKRLGFDSRELRRAFKLLKLDLEDCLENLEGGVSMLLVWSFESICLENLEGFVCNKELYNDDDFEGVIKVSNKKYKYDEEDNGMFFNDEFEYRLMLSSIQEEKEKFILENIVIK